MSFSSQISPHLFFMRKLYQYLYGKGRCQMALFLIPHGAFFDTTWLTFMRHMAHFLIPHGAFFDTTWRTFMHHMAHFYAPHGAFFDTTWRIFWYHMAHFFAPHGAFFDTTWRIFMHHLAHFTKEEVKRKREKSLKFLLSYLLPFISSFVMHAKCKFAP